MLIKWRTAQSRAAESRRLVGSLKLVYLPTYFPNAANWCLESAESSAERSFVNSATVSLLSRNRPSPTCQWREVRKLQSIIGSNSHEISPCQRSGAFLRTNFLQSHTTNLRASRTQGLFHCRCCH